MNKIKCELFEETLGCSKTSYITYLSFKHYKKVCRKYKWNKYVYPYLSEVIYD